jgi:hypothetical protein
MAKLDLYSGREPHVVELEVSGEKKEFKLPTDYTEEEIERILELEKKLEESSDVTARRSIVFSQIQILLNRYQPDFTLEQVKKILTWSDALRIINFISEHTFAVATKTEEAEVDSKKKQPVKN